MLKVQKSTNFAGLDETLSHVIFILLSPLFILRSVLICLIEYISLAKIGTEK
jgi:hypothetical protein